MNRTTLRLFCQFAGQLALVFCLFILAVTCHSVAQDTSNYHPATDPEKIADALRAGPSFITENATILDWPLTPGGEYRLL